MKLNGSICMLCLFYLVDGNGVGCNSYNIPNSSYVGKISSTSGVEINDENTHTVEKYRDKRALGLILSGLAQIFGYTPTSIQLASLPNPFGSDNNPVASGGNNQSSSLMPTTQRPSNSPNQAASSSSTRTTSMPMTTTTTTMTTTTTATMAGQPGQKETIRFTGVVNFGNRSDVIGHLQQYERIFHGSQTTSPPGSTSSIYPITSSTTPSTTFSTMSSFDVRESLKYRPPLLTPYLVKIPLPIAPNLPPPISPTTNINVSVKGTNNLPRIKEQEIVYRKNENIENYTVENKDIKSEKDVVGIPEGKFQHNVYVGEPYWKKLHEERITQLERKQQECSEKLMERDNERNRNIYRDGNDPPERKGLGREEERDDNYREDEQKNPVEKDDYHRERDYSGDVREDDGRGNDEKDEDNVEESENSRERYEERPRPSGNPSDYQREKDEKNIEDYEDYEDDHSYRNGERRENFDVPSTTTRSYDDGYANLNYDKPLPINDYYEKEGTPVQQIRDSYGEILDNRALVDERIANYYGDVKNQRIVPPNLSGFNEETDDTYEDRPLTNDKDDKRNNEDPYKKLREEYAIIPLENKYEEYNLDDTVQTERNDNNDESVDKKYENDSDSNKNNDRTIQKSESTELVDKTANRINSKESKSKKVSNIRNNVIPNKNKTFEEFALVKNSPYILPIRYVYGPDELEDAKTRSYHSEKVEKEEEEEEEDGRSSGTIGARSTNDVNKSRRKKLKVEEVTPKMGIPERLTEKRLHEGERKEIQIWPAPFDFVFDSTEQTNVLIPVNTKDSKSRERNIIYHSPVVPTRTMIYEQSPNTLRYLAPFVPMHYRTYQQPTYILSQ